MNRKIIEVEIQEGKFEFFVIPNINEKARIERKMVEILGGWKSLGEIDSAIKEAANKHSEFSRKKYGKKNYLEKLRELDTLESTGMLKPRFYTLFKEVNNNPHYIEFRSLLNRKVKAADYGHLLVMCKSKPKNIDLSTCDFIVLDNILTEILKKRENKSQHKEQVFN